MKIVLAYSSKQGLLREFLRRFPEKKNQTGPECFAEGDTEQTISAVLSAISSFGHTVRGVEADAGFEAELMADRPDLVYNISEGLFGDSREAYVPTVCEKLSIPCTGSGPLTLSLCLHKGRCKEILTANGIPNAAFRVFRPGDAIDFSGFSFPVIIKPASEGSSKGIFDKSVCDTPEEAHALIEKELEEYAQSVIMEDFLPGAEFTVAMIGNGQNIEVLPIVGFDFSQLPKGARKIYSYEAKWVWDRPEAPLQIFQCPAPVTRELRTAIEDLVRKSFRVLEIRDWCRMDVRLDADGRPNLIEVNPIPGILPDPEEHSCFPEAARAAGYSYEQIFGKVIEAALARFPGGVYAR